MTRHEYIHEDSFEFESGGSVSGLRVVYHTSDIPYRPSGDTRKVVWICHALTANSDPSDWWPELVGPGRFFDTDRYFVVCANMPGSAYGSSGPSSLSASGRPYFFDFPLITVRDIVRAEILVRRHLGISRIDLLIGGSIGGFQALEWSVMEPDVISKAAYIACGARVTPWLTAWNESQRMALEADPTFRKAEDIKGGEAGLRAARSIALISYRSYEGYNSTQQEPSEDTLFADRAGSYQRYQGKKLSDRFDAYSYYYLTKSVDSHNLGRGRGGVEKALGSIRCRCAVIGIDSDRLFPVEEQKFIAAHIPGAEYHEITSRFGHDGFLLEYFQLREILEKLI
ncbi:MAG: homoserine O-acetyltransferase [Bacteroidetes bacterium]|uniref:Homoserine O-acetyltransferase n=1 Tax=Candidatus Cryptobacteroides intestinigallinarum TaxID=2840767 RepID=A0A9D9N079_9BACT|nr:homoserine O-acetyltransferase [Candidatus Cryptobacteroides intestinigallinarum]